jgi:hypothetical protein
MSAFRNVGRSGVLKPRVLHRTSRRERRSHLRAGIDTLGIRDKTLVTSVSRAVEHLKKSGKEAAPLPYRPFPAGNNRLDIHPGSVYFESRRCLLSVK